MKDKPIRQYPIIACCGIDCGLCPQYISKGSSRCPGCGGENFYEKHPSCGILSCCTIKHPFQTCAECDEFPCPKFKGWDAADSFVSHKNTIMNLKYIKENGISNYIHELNRRIEFLEKWLHDYDDGRSKSKYCLATTLFSLKTLEAITNDLIQEIQKEKIDQNDLKGKAKKLKNKLEKACQMEKIELKLRKGQKTK